MHPWPAIVRLARRQRGLVALRQALALGVASSTFHRRVADEGWARLAPGAYALPGVDIDQERRARAAALALGPRAALTGRSALCLHGIDDAWPTVTDLVVPAPTTVPRWRATRIRRVRSLAPGDVVSRAGIRVATVQRALLDAAVSAAPSELEGLLIDTRQRGTDLALVRARARAATPPTPGRRPLLTALDVVEGTGADSMLVRLVEERLRADGIAFDVPPRSVPVADRVLHPDITLTGLPVALECDGRAKYDARRGLDLDQRKHNAYRLVDWWVLRIGWRRVHDDWSGFLAELRAAIALAARP